MKRPPPRFATPVGRSTLARPGALYMLYLEKGGDAKLMLEPRAYRAHRFDPRTGEWRDLPDAGGTEWRVTAPDAEGWAFLLEAR